MVTMEYYCRLILTDLFHYLLLCQIIRLIKVYVRSTHYGFCMKIIDNGHMQSIYFLLLILYGCFQQLFLCCVYEGLNVQVHSHHSFHDCHCQLCNVLTLYCLHFICGFQEYMYISSLLSFLPPSSSLYSLARYLQCLEGFPDLVSDCHSPLPTID